MNRELLKQALHHLEALADDLRRIPSDIAQTIAALEAELAKPEQEPTLFFGRAVYFADPCTGEILPPPDLSIEANRVAYDVAMHYANKTKETLG